ncbi:Dps DNA-binding ferritin-like protein (oxidative damage protectant) [uncultured Caudovirales phage]|uniref:Dps DNA-binding ferritin-like protein (Oxidative damage protectant) n=1 Tax=uncultured Caudovirales phage TaxID=2100421 RepID=A0A6J5P1V7_9CAUD|nr:Dps DNA-binding ferritin-like protein (oxidative damage protectant) [uncultured Caudovirales phage]
MNTAQQLTQVFNDNFVAYFRSHVAHVNTMGRNFQSDHTLLGTIYEDLQDQIDVIAELLRSIGEFMPCCVADVTTGSHIEDEDVEGSADDLLATVRDNLDHLKDCYEELMVIANSEGHEPIGNYAQDRILTLAKYLWMLDSTLS